MTGTKPTIRRAVILTGVLILGLILAGCAGPMVQQQAGPIVLQPVQPQPDASRLRAGMAVYYIPALFKGIHEIPKGKRLLLEGDPGRRPIPMLNHKWTADQKLFDSGRSQAVGMYLYGYLRFPQAGEYVFRAMSNDGLRLFLNGQMVLNDPTVHSARLTPPTPVTVTAPGWCAFDLYYFQRSASARLELHWKTPGMADFQPVPAEAYGHLPGVKPGD